MLNPDTHVLLCALTGDLTSREYSLLSTDSWSISTIVLWEIAKLSELGRIEIDDMDSPELTRTLARIQTWPLTLDICRTIQTLDFDSDPADEIIGAHEHRTPPTSGDTGAANPTIQTRSSRRLRYDVLLFICIRTVANKKRRSLSVMH